MLLELGLLGRSVPRWEERGLAACGREHCCALLLEMELVATAFHVDPIWVWSTGLSVSLCSCLGRLGEDRNDKGTVWGEAGWRWRCKWRSTWICVLLSNYIGCPGFSHWNVTVSENRLMVPALCLLGTLTRLVAVVLCFLLFCFFPAPALNLPGRQPRSLMCGTAVPRIVLPVSFDSV